MQGSTIKNTGRKLFPRTIGKTTGAVVVAAAMSIVATVPLAPAVQAAQGNILFGVNITTNNACVVLVRRGGTMTQNVGGDVLSSKNAGGVTGIADVYSIFNYQVTVDPPPFFLTAPAGGNNGVSFETTFSGTSITNGVNFGEQAGNIPVTLNSGFSGTRVTVDVTATRPDGFPAGSYQTVSIVRCE